jgi:hypothetical protein
MPDLVSPELLPPDEDGQGNVTALERRTGRERIARDKLTVAQMKARMAALYAEGTYIEAIASQVSEEFGLEVPIVGKTVSYHIQNMLAHWRNLGLKSIDEKQAMVLARYDQLEMLAQQAYFASMGGKRVTNFERQIEMARSKKRAKEIQEEVHEEAERQEGAGERELMGHDPEGLVKVMEKTKEYTREELSEAGDPRWVAIMVDINDKRAKLWGLYMKDRDVGDPDSEYAALTDEQRDQRLATVLHNAASRRQQNMGNLAPARPLGAKTASEDVPEGEEAAE